MSNGGLLNYRAKNMIINPNVDVPIQRTFHRAAGYFIGSAIFIAVLVLVGWGWDVAFLRSPLAGTVAMNPVTALCLVVAGISIWLTENEHPYLRRAGACCAIFVMLVTFLRLENLWYGFSFKVDLLLFGSRMNALSGSNGLDRMSMSAAFCLLLTAIGLLLLRIRTSRGQMLSQIVALVVGLTALFSLMGYLYKVKEFYGFFRHLPMSLLTALCLLLLTIGILCARPDKGIMRDMTTSLSGSLLARMLVPVATVIPIILGYLRLYGHWAGLFSTEFGLTILVFSIILIFLGTIRYVAILLNKRDVENNRITGELLASENRFHLLVDSIEDYAIFQVNATGHIESWNIGAQKIKGYTAEEVIGKPISIFYSQKDIENGVPQQNMEKARIHGRHSSEGWRIRKDGTRFWGDIVFTALYDGKGQLTGFAKVTRDRTEYKRVQEQIAYQARLMEDATDTIISIDVGYQIVSWNKAAELLYGYTAREVQGRHIRDVVKTRSSDARRELIIRQLQEYGHWKGEVTHHNKNGLPVYILLSISETRDKGGKIDGYVLVGRDIAIRKKQEEFLRKFNEHLEELVRKKTAELVVVFERVSDGFMAFDKNGIITYVNKKAAELNRREAEELIGKNFWRLFPTAIGNEFGENFHRAIDIQQNLHFEMFSPSLELWIECFMYPSEDGLSLFFRDISGKRQAEETITRNNEELRQLASHLQDIREEERATIAREIHDELGQQLTGIKMDVSWLGRGLNKQPEEVLTRKIKGTLDLLDNTIKTVRRIATELRPSILDDLGLIAAIEWQSQEFKRRSGINTFFLSSLVEFDFDPSTAIGLFRICQESLTNVARHSSARNVWISLDWADSELTFRIRDDGKGFSKQATKGTKTLGILGMKERALMMGGRLDIRNEEAGGLTLEVTVPVKKTTVQ
jgi:PAS domain S-box-containing protein